jgi:hypothetical protein
MNKLFEEWWEANGIPQETPSDLVEAYKRAMKYAFNAGFAAGLDEAVRVVMSGDTTAFPLSLKQRQQIAAALRALDALKEDK